MSWKEQVFRMFCTLVCIQSVITGQFIRYTTHSREWIAPTDSGSCGRGLLYKAGIQESRHSVTVHLNIRMGKTSDLSDFERGMIISARHDRSSISEMSGLLGFSHMTVSRVYREWCDKHPAIGSPVGENSSLMREVEGEWQTLDPH